jgi:hypothetical protein
MVLYIEQIENWKTKHISYGLGVSTVDLSTSKTTTFETLIGKHSLNEEIVRLCLFHNPKELVYVRGQILRCLFQATSTIMTR